MNDQKFSELLNLYLDGEISTLQEVQLLKVIDENPDRAREYSRLSKLNTAMEMVLDPQALQPRDLAFRPRFGPALWVVSSICVLSMICVGVFLASIAITPLSDSDSILYSDIPKKKWMEINDLNPQLKVNTIDSFVGSQLNDSERFMLSSVEDMRLMNLSSLRLQQPSHKSQWNRVDGNGTRKNILSNTFKNVSEISVSRKNVQPFDPTNSNSTFKSFRANLYSEQN